MRKNPIISLREKYKCGVYRQCTDWRIGIRARVVTASLSQGTGKAGS